MAFHKLLVDDFYDESYLLFAVHCVLEDYRLAYLLNQSLSLNLKRKKEDIDIQNLNASFCCFEWNNQSEYVTWNLVSNCYKKEEPNIFKEGLLFKTNNEKMINTYHLLSEFKNVDYFIKISDEIQNINEQLVLDKLKRIPQIITSYVVNPQQIKSKDHLIFN